MAASLSLSDENGSASEKLQPPLMRAIRIAPDKVSTALSSQEVGVAGRLPSSRELHPPGQIQVHDELSQTNVEARELPREF